MWTQDTHYAMLVITRRAQSYAWPEKNSTVRHDLGPVSSMSHSRQSTLSSLPISLYECGGVHVHVGAKGHPQVLSLRSHPLCFWDRVSQFSWSPSLRLGWPARELLSPPISVSLTLGLQTSSRLFSICFLGIEPRPSHLLGVTD